MAKPAARAVREANPELKIVLGGISPIDPQFIELLAGIRCDGRGGHGGGARFPAGLEPLADSRVAEEDGRDPRRDGASRFGYPRRGLRRSAPKRCRCSD